MYRSIFFESSAAIAGNTEATRKSKAIDVPELTPSVLSWSAGADFIQNEKSPVESATTGFENGSDVFCQLCSTKAACITLDVSFVN
jgi:hypothetical protein